MTDLTLAPVRWLPSGPGPRSPRLSEPGRTLGALAFGACLGLYLALPLLPSSREWLTSTGTVALPSLTHPLGTDPHGRDLLVGLAHAQSVIYPLVLRAAGLAVGLGLALGLVAGLLRGPVAALVGLACRIVSSFPRLPLVLVVATAFDASFETAAVALGVAFVPDVTGAVRERLDHLMRADFIAAGRAHGLSWARLIGHHVTWLHLTPMLCRQVGHVFAFTVVLEAGLSYLGTLGLYVPVGGDEVARVRFGMLLADAKSALDPTFAQLETWAPMLVEAGFLALLVGGANLVGDRLAQHLGGT